MYCALCVLVFPLRCGCVCSWRGWASEWMTHMYVFLPLCLSCVDAATAAATAVCLWLGSRQRSCLRALVDDSLDLFALPVHVSRSSLVMLCCLRRHAKCVGALPLFQRRIYRCSNRMALRTSDSDEQRDTAGTGILHFLHPPLHSFCFVPRSCLSGRGDLLPLSVSASVPATRHEQVTCRIQEGR